MSSTLKAREKTSKRRARKKKLKVESHEYDIFAYDQRDYDGFEDPNDFDDE